MRTCSWCGAQVPQEAFCADCTQSVPLRPDPETLTADEREAELRGMDRVEVPFDVMHARIERLVGRPVWTHEMTTSNWERLLREARWEERLATMEEIINLVPEEKRIILGAPTLPGGP